MKIKNIISTLLFSTIFISVFFICIFKTDSEFSLSERRALAQMPELSAESVMSGTFMENFESYTQDQFPLRDIFRSYKAFFVQKILGKYENNGLYYQDGHISKMDDDENPYMTNYAAELFTKIYDTNIKGKNSKVYLSVIPDKNFILSPKNGYPCLDYDEFIKNFKESLPFMEYIEIRDLLSLDDYYKTDSHWRQEKIVDIAKRYLEKMGNSSVGDFEENVLDNPFYGVYAGQYGLKTKPDTIKYLTNDVLKSCTVTYYNDMGKPIENSMYDMEKAYGKDPYELFLSGTQALIEIKNPNAKSHEELVIFRDSFGSSLAPLMAESYSKITLVDIRYIQSSFIANFVDFSNKDILFMYSTALLNNSLSMK
ncbi:MAG: hypothetical protein E7394_03505 [Ruminococcaceae bacterium]|nr:hypothetical protein [Oscillospiraceae bacterium]